MIAPTNYYATVGYGAKEKIIIDVFKYGIKENYRVWYQTGYRNYPNLKDYIPELANHDNPHFNKKDFIQYELEILDKLIKQYETKISRG